MSKDLMVEVEDLANGFDTKGDVHLTKILASARTIIIS
jgi:hypothetical protein